MFITFGISLRIKKNFGILYTLYILLSYEKKYNAQKLEKKENFAHFYRY